MINYTDEEEYAMNLAESIDQFSSRLNDLLSRYSEYSLDYSDRSDFGPGTTVEDLLEVVWIEIEIFNPADDMICSVTLVPRDDDSGELDYSVRRSNGISKSYDDIHRTIRELGIIIREDQEVLRDLQEDLMMDPDTYADEVVSSVLEDEPPVLEDLDEVSELEFDPIDEDELLDPLDEPLDKATSSDRSDDTPLDIRMRERIERRRKEEGR